MKLFTPLGVSTDTLASSNVPETLAAYAGGTTYSADVEVRDDATHKAFRSLVGSNVGNPLTDATKWLELGPTNRWGMFDEKLGTYTESPENIETTIAFPGRRVTGIALFGLDATSLNLTITDPTDGAIVYPTIDLNSYANVNNFYDYFFNPLLRKRDVFIGDLPLYAGASIKLRINNPGGVARCGSADFGEVVTLGRTEWGMEFGGIDYSKKEGNQFGHVTLIERSHRSTGAFSVDVDPIYTDYVLQTLADLRAKVSVFIGTDRYGAGLIKGFPRSHRIISKNPAFDVLSVSLESLT